MPRWVVVCGPGMWEATTEVDRERLTVSVFVLSPPRATTQTASYAKMQTGKTKLGVKGGN